MDIKGIIQGHFNEVFNFNEDMSKNRLNICYRCPLYSPKLGGICNDKLWMNVNTGQISSIKKPGYINGCSCRLTAKTRVPEAKCPANKW